MKKNFVTTFVFAGCLMFTSGFAAEHYRIDWHTMNGGGGVSTGGGYSIRSAIGLVDAGSLSGGSYRLVGGFWGGPMAIQTEGAPLLTITLERLYGRVTISWPLPATGFVLETTPTLKGSPVPWKQVTLPYQSNGTDVFVHVPFTAQPQFYRLRKL